MPFPPQVQGPGPPYRPCTGILKHRPLCGISCVLSTNVVSHGCVLFCFCMQKTDHVFLEKNVKAISCVIDYSGSLQTFEWIPLLA